VGLVARQQSIRGDERAPRPLWGRHTPAYEVDGTWRFRWWGGTRPVKRTSGQPPEGPRPGRGRQELGQSGFCGRAVLVCGSPDGSVVAMTAFD